jgi:hypothetical protein
MERLPYIDTHEREIAANRSEAWTALLSSMRQDLGGSPPRLFVRTWGLEPAVRRGEWKGTVSSGDSLPGFEVDEVVEPRRLGFAGRHRFSRYALTFSLTATPTGATVVSAETRAAFPGLLGRGYKAAVIGTGMHGRLVARMLRQVEERL